MLLRSMENSDLSKVPLSAEDICFCASEDGCNGGDIDTPWEHVKSHGAVTG